MSLHSKNINNDNYEESFHLLRQDSSKSVFQPVRFENINHENNCFISVVFHSLYHFDELKNYLINIQLNKDSPQLMIQIVSILNLYQNINKNLKEKDILKTNQFRNELADIFKQKNEFQLNKEGDPIELLNYLLNCIHTFIISHEKEIGISEDKCKENCLVHKLFYINLTEISRCTNCKKETKLDYDNFYFIELLNVNSILESIKDKEIFTKVKGNLMHFSRYGIQQCGNCKKQIEKEYICKSIGKYFIINLGWNGNFSKMKDLCNLYIMIGGEFELKDLYNKCNNKKFYFIGMLLYWSNHYICLFYEKKLKKFIIYDDQLIKEFSSWKDLIENLIMGNYQPVALIYSENNNDVILKFDLTEIFYKNIIQVCKEHDQKKQLIAVSAPGIKEDEWECDFCKQINNNNFDICSKCGRSNQNIAFLLESKYELLVNMNEKKLSEEDKNFIENYKLKKKKEEITEKWICPVCNCKTNLVTNPICGICNSKNNDLYDMIIKKNNKDIENKKENEKNIVKEKEKIENNKKENSIENNKNENSIENNKNINSTENNKNINSIENNKNINSIENNKQIKKEEEITEKWICPNCKCKTNLVTNPICTICNLKNDDLNEINDSNNNVTIFINKTKGKNKKEDINQILKEQEKNDNTKNIKIENNKNIKKEEEINEKWICPNCGCKTNLITQQFCFNCKKNNNELNDRVLENYNHHNNHKEQEKLNKKLKKREQQISIEREKEKKKLIEEQQKEEKEKKEREFNVKKESKTNNEIQKQNIQNYYKIENDNAINSNLISSSTSEKSKSILSSTSNVKNNNHNINNDNDNDNNIKKNNNHNNNHNINNDNNIKKSYNHNINNDDDINIKKSNTHNYNINNNNNNNNDNIKKSNNHNINNDNNNNIKNNKKHNHNIKNNNELDIKQIKNTKNDKIKKSMNKSVDYNEKSCDFNILKNTIDSLNDENICKKNNLKKDEWECSKCNNINKESNIKCEICGNLSEKFIEFDKKENLQYLEFINKENIPKRPSDWNNNPVSNSNNKENYNNKDNNNNYKNKDKKKENNNNKNTNDNYISHKEEKKKEINIKIIEKNEIPNKNPESHKKSGTQFLKTPDKKVKDKNNKDKICENCNETYIDICLNCYNKEKSLNISEKLNSKLNKKEKKNKDKICEKCNETYTDFCLNCYNKEKSLNISEKYNSKLNKKEKKNKELMNNICPYCKVQCIYENKCLKCGEIVKWQCEKCGNENSIKKLKCQKCGEKNYLI